MSSNKLVISRETAEKILSFRNERNWSQFHNPKDLAISVSLEAAELLECFQWSGSDTEVTSKLEAMKEEFKRLGVYPENTYLFIQGHHLLDNVIMRLLVPVCTYLRREREQQINDLALHETQRRNELTAYQRSQVDVTLVIHKNTNYKDSPTYQMIRRDVENFLRIIKV